MRKKNDFSVCPPMSWSEIDLKALVYNAAQIKKYAGEDTQVLAVVKSQAYGHGLKKVVKVLNKKGVSFFGITDINEAITIRSLKVKKPILMLENVLPQNASFLVKHKITPVLCTLELAKALNIIAGKKRIKFSVHIKIDTGMGRLGVWHKEAFDFIKDIKRLSNLKIEGLCTHFPVADTNPKFTKMQIKEFLSLVRDVRENIVPIHFVHAANSMGLINYHKKDFNLVRTGIMLYGLYPSQKIKAKIKLKPVMSVKARICFLKDVLKGRKISYGHTFTAKKDMRIATVSIGYSDGYSRAFSSNAFVLVSGIRCPVAGTVTMDQIMIDVSNVRNAKVGDEVCVLGRQKKECITAEELARAAGTINYEVLCSLGKK